jgi:hypothetical protein
MKKLAVLAAALSLALAGCEGPTKDQGKDRWATTENLNVQIDWDKVNKAYEQAAGPEDFEKRVNEIYEGDEIISVAVQDLDDKTQVVTGFFDKNASGTVDEPEKVFTIRREVTGEGTGQYSTQGHGYYAGYHSPMLSIASGMLMGAMLSSALSPGYAPMYRQPYTTDAARRGELRNQRASYRAANPGKYSPGKASKTGKTYGGGRRGGGGVPRGGGRFGIRRITRSPDGSRMPGAARPERLTA